MLERERDVRVLSVLAVRGDVTAVTRLVTSRATADGTCEAERKLADLRRFYRLRSRSP